MELAFGVGRGRVKGCFLDEGAFMEDGLTEIEGALIVGTDVEPTVIDGGSWILIFGGVDAPFTLIVGIGGALEILIFGTADVCSRILGAGASGKLMAGTTGAVADFVSGRGVGSACTSVPEEVGGRGRDGSCLSSISLGFQSC